MIYEQRIYRCLPGQLPRLLKRFQNDTLRIWAKHGIRQAGFFTTLIGESNRDLPYLLQWDSLADRSAFMADPDWHSARDDSEKAGPIIENVSSQIFVPTAFSSMK